MQLHSKERALLRAQAQVLEPMFQIGIGGLSDTVMIQIKANLKRNELGKVTVLETCPETPSDLQDKFNAQAIDVIQVIGRSWVLYQKNHDLKRRKAKKT
jgi:RNA-binding protein